MEKIDGKDRWGSVMDKYFCPLFFPYFHRIDTAIVKKRPFMDGNII